MTLLRWRFFDALEIAHVKISKAELVITSLLLIAGGIVLGIGLTSFAFWATGLAVSITGGVMLFGGIVLTIKTFNEIANALLGTNKAIESVNDHVKNVQDTTFRSVDSKINPVNNFERQFDTLKKRVDNIVAELKRHDISVTGG